MLFITSVHATRQFQEQQKLLCNNQPSLTQNLKYVPILPYLSIQLTSQSVNNIKYLYPLIVIVAYKDPLSIKA